ncbi:MAG: transcriptional repressor [Alphaproteobacteria bacterium]|nr:transcriptional repressor [Alphaproteobacteria bacterium]
MEQNSKRQPAGTSPYAAGCSFAQVRKRLQDAGLRPTRQRVTLGWLLFARGDRHVTAEKLFDEVRTAKSPMSLATVYNTLHQFSEAGLVREIALYGSTVWYDTNTGPHYHYYVADRNELVDIPPDMVEQLPVPRAPEGMEVIGADLIVRVRALPAKA